MLRPASRISNRLTAAWFLVCLVFPALSPAWARLTPDQLAQLPPPAPRQIRFSVDVRPILETSCIKCHGRGRNKGGFKLDTRESTLQPADSGPAVVVGDSARSPLIAMVSGLDPDNVMPKKGSKLTREQVSILRAWIDQGMSWDNEVTFAKPEARNLTPRKAAVPAGTEAHPIDRLLGGYLDSHQVQLASIDDRRFARRAYLDLVGLLPTPEEMNSFIADPAANKRERLVRSLLSDNPRYAQHWLTFWNDLLRNDYKGTGFIDGGRRPISQWLYAALRDNKPYDQFVRELVNPTEASEGFTKGIVWRGVVNASMTPQMQAAQNIGQVFMGVNLKCASCHDSFIDDWQLSDSYGLAGIYAEGPLEMVQCDKPTGKFAPLRFLFPELGNVDPKASKPERLRQLASILTDTKNGRLSRTVVNRLWARFLGRGLVEPQDVMQNEAWHPVLLDWLAEDLVAHGWNLKHTIEVILTSKAYQSTAVDAQEKEANQFVFRGPVIRRLTAEQFRDGLSALTGVWADKPEGGLDKLLVEPGAPRALPADAYWVWGDPHGATGVPPGTNWFRKSFQIAAKPAEATVFVHADNRARLWVNGQPAKGSDSGDWSQAGVYDIRAALKTGTNTIAVEVVNGGDGPNPAGVLLYARVRSELPADGKAPRPDSILDFATDTSWKTSRERSAKWEEAGFDDRAWSPAQVLGPAGMGPWNIGESLAGMVSGKPIYGSIRASLTASDPLMLALGRPNREQITTVRAQTATTLQALELTNGGTLSQFLKRGAEKLVARGETGSALARRVFEQALGRTPTAAELQLATELLGSQPAREGIEDLLWSVAMLPEFQLIL